MRRLKAMKIPLIALGVFFALLVEFADYVTGPEIAFSLFYLLVVCFFTWFVGRSWGIGASWLFAVFSVITDLITGHYVSHIAIAFWTAVMRGILFTIVSIILSLLKQELWRQRRNNQQLLNAYERIKKLAKVKSDFAAAVSHELRTPLSAIRESIQIIYEDGSSTMSEEKKNFLEMARRNAERLTRLINDILDFSKLDSGKRKLKLSKTNINDLVFQVIAFLKPLIEGKEILLRCEVDPQITESPMDSDAVTQVLTNLLDNAIKFTEFGEIQIGTLSRGNEVEVFVRDTGRGIRKEECEKAFEPFEQCENSAPHGMKGTGLGLAISKQIIEQHGGKIWIHSGLGMGATVHFTLPLSPSIIREMSGAGR